MNTSKKLTTIAVLSVIAYISMLIIKFPIQFLNLDIKDVIIAIGGIILGIIPAIIISFLVAFLEFVTISESGIIGFFMNFLATISFILPIVFIYKKFNSNKSLFISIILATISMTVIMVLFNILISPIYLSVPLDEVLKLLPTLIIPFNIGKGLLNGFLILILLNPIIKALKKSNLYI